MPTLPPTTHTQRRLTRTALPDTVPTRAPAGYSGISRGVMKWSWDGS